MGCKTWIFLWMMMVVLDAYSQVIMGEVIDSETEQVVKSANIQFKDTGTHTDAEGKFILRLYDLTGTLSVSHIGYEDYQRLITPHDFMYGILELRIELQPKVFQIKPVEISVDAAPKVVFSHKLKHVSDFELTDSGIFVIAYSREKRFKSQELIHSKIVKEAVLYYTNRSQLVIDSLELGHGQFSLEKDFRKRTILSCEHVKYYVNVNNEEIELIKIDPTYFHSFLEVTSDSLNDYYYYSTFQKDFPSFEYYAFNSQDKSYELLHQTSDKIGMEFLRSDYKYLDGKHKVEAMNLAQYFEVDKEIIAAKMTGFAQSQYFRMPYVPLKVINDRVVVFDHNQNHLMFYNDRNDLTDSIGINYHLKRNLYDKWEPAKEWTSKLFFDETNGSVFTSYLKKGHTWICEIDLKTGQTLRKQKLHYRYIENLQIADGRAYYTYRPFESSQKKFLYEEKVYCGLSSSSK